MNRTLGQADGFPDREGLGGVGRCKPGNGEELADETVVRSLHAAQMAVRDMVRAIDAIRFLYGGVMVEGGQQNGRQDDCRQEDCI